MVSALGEKIMAGGFRKGSGRKRGTNNKVMLSVRIDPVLRAWLKKQKNQTRIVETGIQMVKKTI